MPIRTFETGSQLPAARLERDARNGKERPQGRSGPEYSSRPQGGDGDSNGEAEGREAGSLAWEPEVTARSRKEPEGN